MIVAAVFFKVAKKKILKSEPNSFDITGIFLAMTSNSKYCNKAASSPDS